MAPISQVSTCLFANHHRVHFAVGTKEGKDEGDNSEEIAKRKERRERKKVLRCDMVVFVFIMPSRLLTFGAVDF